MHYPLPNLPARQTSSPCRCVPVFLNTVRNCARTVSTQTQRASAMASIPGRYGESSPQNLMMWKLEQTPTLRMNGAALPH
mgnify:CR=1 FL=1